MVEMAVCQQHGLEPRPVLKEGALERNQMIRVANAGIDEHSRAFRAQQIGMVAGTAHRAGVARVEHEAGKHWSLVSGFRRTKSYPAAPASRKISLPACPPL